jgi:UrcA family protein
MSIKQTHLLCASAGAAAIALGLAFTVSAQPRFDSFEGVKTYGHTPYTYAATDYQADTSATVRDPSYVGVKSYGNVPYAAAASDYEADTSATVGGLTVYASPRQERSANGAPIELVRVSRIVQIGDLDLSTADGVRELHSRVERAAYDACSQLDSMPGMIPQDSDSDCQHDAVARAMDNAPLGDRPY